MRYARFVQLAAFGLLTLAACDDEVLTLNFPRDASSDRSADAPAVSDSAAAEAGETGAPHSDAEEPSDAGSDASATPDASDASTRDAVADAVTRDAADGSVVRDAAADGDAASLADTASDDAAEGGDEATPIDDEDGGDDDAGD